MTNNTVLVFNVIIVLHVRKCNLKKLDIMLSDNILPLYPIDALCPAQD